MNMTPKDTCEVLSNNRDYCKKLFGYHFFAKNKIRATRRYTSPDYKKAKSAKICGNL